MLKGPRTDPHELVFLALLELVVRGGAALVPVPDADADEYALAPGEPERTPARPLAVLVELIAEAMTLDVDGPRGFAPTPLVAVRFAHRWGTADGYVRHEVWSPLEERGFITTRRGVLDLFAVNAWHLTDDGHRERARLREMLAGDDEWTRHPVIALLRLGHLTVPSRATLDGVRRLEDLVTPTDWWIAGGTGGM